VIRKILIAFAILFAVMLLAGVFIGMQPGVFSVERSATMAAPTSRAFAQVNDLQAWDVWSPWKELDPNSKVTISNPSAGVGATFTWAGNDKIGEGRLRILESRPNELVDVEQEFFKPFAGKARMAFTFAPMSGGTRVTWRMEGTNDFIGKAVCLFMDMNAKLGGDFERGLANMKTLVENGEE